MIGTSKRPQWSNDTMWATGPNECFWMVPTRQKWFHEKTWRSYLHSLKKEKKKKKRFQTPSGFNFSQPHWLAVNTFWLDGNQLIGGAQDWRKRGLEKNMKKGGYFCLWCFIHFCFPYRDWKKCMGKLLLCCHLAYFILRTLFLCFPLLYSFFLFFALLNQLLPLISSYSSTLPLFLAASISLFPLFSLFSLCKEALFWKCWMQLFNVWSVFYHP